MIQMILLKQLLKKQIFIIIVQEMLMQIKKVKHLIQMILQELLQNKLLLLKMYLVKQINKQKVMVILLKKLKRQLLIDKQHQQIMQVVHNNKQQMVIYVQILKHQILTVNLHLIMNIVVLQDQEMNQNH